MAAAVGGQRRLGWRRKAWAVLRGKMFTPPGIHTRRVAVVAIRPSCPRASVRGGSRGQRGDTVWRLVCQGLVACFASILTMRVACRGRLRNPRHSIRFERRRVRTPASYGRPPHRYSIRAKSCFSRGMAVGGQRMARRVAPNARPASEYDGTRQEPGALPSVQGRRVCTSLAGC